MTELPNYRMAVSRRAIALVLGLVLSLMASWAIAQQPDERDPEAQATALAEEGTALYAAGELESAIEKFREALDYVRDPAFAFNIAYISDELERYYAAYQYYELYVDLYPGAPNLADVETRLGELEEILRREYAELVVTTEPSNAEIWVEWDERTVSLGSSPVSGFVPPGQVSIEARLDGYLPMIRQRTAVAGVRLEVDMGQLVPDVVEPVAEPLNWKRISGWSLVGVGSASVLAGIILWGSAQADANEYESEREQISSGGSDLTLEDFQSLRDDADHKARLGNIFFSVGLIAAAGGAAILLFWDSEILGDSALSSPQIHVIPGGAALGWSGRF